MIREGKYILKKQINGRGYFTHIKLQVEDSDKLESSISFSEGIDDLWYTEIFFAINYFFDFYYKNFPKHSFEIKIKYLSDFPVDTTNISIVFAVFKALEDAFKIETNGVNFDKESGSLILPHFATIDMIV